MMRKGGDRYQQAGVRWAECERTKQRDAASPYLDSKCRETVWASLKRVPARGRPEQVRLGQGLRLLPLRREGGLRTAVKRAKRGLIAKKYLKFCPCCKGKEGEGESFEHLLTDCQRWKDRREQCTGAVLSVVAGTRIGSKEEKVVLLLAGG